ncbi:hypothetical protein KJ750_02160 [Patescibacteria group bacterium]|nr:hypothetical protein [Patescibacteria group bacterium]
MNDVNTIEDERLAMLNQARKAIVASPIAKAGLVFSFGKKVSNHWLILMAAVIFDILALIPFISVVFNLLFGLVLFLYFGPKSKGGSEFTRIVLPIGIGSIFDFFLSVLPVNIAAALIRIALNDK